MENLATWIHSGQLVTLVMAALHFTHRLGWRGLLAAMVLTGLCLLPWYLAPVWLLPALPEYAHLSAGAAVGEVCKSAMGGVCVARLWRAGLRLLGVEMGKIETARAAGLARKARR